MVALSADNKVELWRILTTDSDKFEKLMLKRMKKDGKKAVKRAMVDGQIQPLENAEMLDKIKSGDYDLSLHFRQED